MDAQESLFALDCFPSKILDFVLEDGSEPAECILQLTNKNSQSVAFKVKTTKPKRYLVRPNQGMVAPSESLQVSIVLLAQDKMGLISEFRQTGGCNETNKFMVQALPLQGADATASTVPPGIWEEAKAKVQQKKLVVNFTFPRALAPSAAASLKQVSNGIREAVGGENRVRFATGAEESLQGGDGSDVSQDQVWAQAAELRRKYDDLVSFTINLTAEKDLIQRSLGATKEDLAREQQARKQLEAKMMEPGARRPSGSVIGKTAPSESSSGFSLFFVLVVAMLALFAGQWTASNGYPLLFGSAL